jgi:exosortase/archaeosortase family protein
VPTDIIPHLTRSHKFVLRGAAASLALFALLRSTWIDARLVLPFTGMQAALAARWLGEPAAPVAATLACSGSDALALCVGAVLAYPVAWRTRLTGVAAGAVLVVGLNVLRIGTLGLAAASPQWFTTLHLYAWPAVLTLAIAGYVLAWMRHADRANPASGMSVMARPSRRFVVLAIAFLIVFLAASPFYLASARVLALATLVARGAAALLRAIGVPAHAEGNVLWTGSGAFMVTQECIATPLIPVYLAAVCAAAPAWRRVGAGLVATVPLFLALGVARLLLVALPAAAPLFWVHAFYQLLAAAIVVWAAARWRDRCASMRRALCGLLAGVAAGVMAAPLLARVVAASGGGPLTDPQGAIAFAPAFQIALYVALCTAAWTRGGWSRALAGLAILAGTVPVATLLVRALALHAGVAPHVRDVRAWAIVAPLSIFTAVMTHAPARR